MEMKAQSPPEWIKLETELQSLSAQVRQKQASVDRLIEEKRLAEDPSRVAEVIRKLASEQNSLRVAVENYNQKRTLLKYRYPERKASYQRKYEKIEVNAIEELERRLALSRRILAARKKIQLTYGISFKKDVSKNENIKQSSFRSPASVQETLDSTSLHSGESSLPRKDSHFIRLIDETPILKR
jgi:hypothetical protein